MCPASIFAPGIPARGNPFDFSRPLAPEWIMRLAAIAPAWAPSLLAFLLTLTIAGGAEPRLNQIQVIGSHNSYHRAPPAEVLEIIGKFQKNAVTAWGYTHPPLAEQLAAGIRQFELDTYADPQGGLFAKPLAVQLAALAGKPVAAFDPEGALKKPGFKVLHVPDLDCWSQSPTLASALSAMATWSQANPQHLPVMVLMECKDDAHPPLPTRPVPFSRERLLELEQEILTAIPQEKIFRPDDLRQEEASLPAAIQRHGWPTLAALRGKFIFALDNTNVVRERYLETNPTLEGRLLFVSAPDEQHPAAAWFKCNDPQRDHAKIQALVQRGFLVRTRADTSQPEAVMRERAFSSGAQWVSSDHFAPESPAESRVEFGEGRLVRPNPLTGDASLKIIP
jgi:hypothetical protein